MMMMTVIHKVSHHLLFAFDLAQMWFGLWVEVTIPKPKDRKQQLCSHRCFFFLLRHPSPLTLAQPLEQMMEGGSAGWAGGEGGVGERRWESNRCGTVR